MRQVDRLILASVAGAVAGLGTILAHRSALLRNRPGGIENVHHILGRTFHSGDDVIISTMGLRSVSWWPGSRKPYLVEWPGVISNAGGHPSWFAAATSLRRPDGQLLPNLLARYNLSGAKRIAVVGFSAGSNSGVRELIRNAEDRKRISFVGAFDGLHPVLSQQSTWNLQDPMSFFVSPKQLEPWLAYMALAAAGRKGMVMTASSIPEPAPNLSTSKFALTKCLEQTGIAAGRLSPGQDPWLDIVPGGNDMPLPDATQHVVQQETKTRVRYATIGALRALEAERSKNVQADHLAQAAMIPAVLRATLVPLWQASSQS